MQAESSTESEADKKGMVVEVLSPNRNKGKKRKFKQSKIQIHGEKTSWSSNYQNKTVNPVQDQKRRNQKQQAARFA